MNNLLKIAEKSPEDFIELIIKSHNQLEWEVQGFGMLRTYLTSKEVRLHIWDSRLAVQEVSTIHTHPWDFTSLVLRGVQTNELFREVQGQTHNCATILCGHNAAIKSKVNSIALELLSKTSYCIREGYEQKSEEIHRSLPQDGTITLVERHSKGDADHAKVYWPIGTHWIDAKPRAATKDEVEMIIKSL